MSTFAISELSQRLRGLFSEEDSVRPVYVFDSQVEGTTGPLSDLDVAVLVTDAFLDTPTACRAARVEYETHVLERYGDFRTHCEQIYSDHCAE